MDDLYLLANPYFIKKKYIKNKEDDIQKLFILLNKIFNINIDTKNYNILLTKLEIILFDFQIDSIVDNLINNIFNEILGNDDIHQRFDH